MRQVVRDRGQPRRPQEGEAAPEKVSPQPLSPARSPGDPIIRSFFLFFFFFNICYIRYLVCVCLLSNNAFRPVYRVKQLREEPYTQKEAEAAAGLSTDNEGHERRADVADAEMEMTT